jgi:hypothetical protein
MSRKAYFGSAALALLVLTGFSLPSLADDSAASIAAGGLVARRETRIVMAKEVLRISDKKVIVDYDFRNDSDQDVTTEVAFPIPPYENGTVLGPSPEEQSFQSFKLWIDGKSISYKSEATATVDGKDVTSILRANHIDIPTFGHWEDKTNAKGEEVIDTPDFSRLPTSTRDQLIKAGIFNDSGSRWAVHLQYHWTQTFPAHSTVHIRHEYTPTVGWIALEGIGAEQVLLDAEKVPEEEARRKPRDPKNWWDVTSFCLGPSLAKNLATSFHQQEINPSKEEGPGPRIPMHWVDFILTTANTWKQPIEDFTLIVERPAPLEDWKSLISFCSPENGKVEKLDADHFQVHLKNFIPTAELHIGFFDIPNAKPVAKK